MISEQLENQGNPHGTNCFQYQIAKGPLIGKGSYDSEDLNDLARLMAVVSL